MSLGDRNLQTEVMARAGVDIAGLLKTISQLQQQNQEILAMLKIAINNINDDEDEFVIQAIALITKIEKGE